MSKKEKRDYYFSLKLAYYYFLSKLKFLHVLLPYNLQNKLPVGWSFHMFWVAFKSGGTRIYNDYYAEMKAPKSYQPQAKVKPTFQLKEEDIRFFYENGYLGPFDLVSADEAEDFRQYLIHTILETNSKTWKYQFEKESGLADELFPTDEDDDSMITEEYKKTLVSHVNKTNRHLEYERLLGLFQKPEITERCAQLLGPDLLLWRSDCFEVPGFNVGTPWHQSSNWLLQNMRESVANPPDSDELHQVTCWIALTDANKERGCMRVIPGTHTKMYPLVVNRDINATNQLYRYDKGPIDFPFEQAKEELIEVKAGQFFIFSERVIHGSVPNQTDLSRWAINCRISKTDTKFFTKRMFKEGHQITYHRLKNVNIDKWRAVLLRGKDKFGYNKLFEGFATKKEKTL
ncbi:MAG: phytanoyl-CoA dioxygenase family protein [Chitinophagales bacterium]